MSYWWWQPSSAATVLGGTRNVSVTDSGAAGCLEPGNYATNWFTHDEPVALLSDAVSNLDTGGAPVSKSVSDSCSLPLIESPAILVTLTVTDSGVIVASEANTVLNSFSASDAIAVQGSELATVLIAFSTADSLILGLTEGAPAFLFTIPAIDTCAIQGADSSMLTVAFGVADTVSLVVSEVAATTVLIPAIDSCAMICLEPGNYATTWATHDEPVVVASDPQPTVDTGSSVIAKSVSDSCAVIASSELPAILVTQPAVDACAVQASESASISSTISASDTVLVGLAEATPNVSQTLILTATDAMVVGTADLAAYVVVMPATESCNIVCTEPSFYATTWQTHDEPAVILSDPPPTVDTGSVLITKSASDICAVGLTDAVTFITLDSYNGGDSCAVQIDELTTRNLSVTDSLTIQASDASPTITFTVVASDTCVVVISEASPAVAAVFTVTDSLAVIETESTIVLSTVSSTESAGIGATEAVLIQVAATISDSATLGLSEASAIAAVLSASDSAGVILSESALINQVVSTSDSCAIVASDVTVGPHAATTSDLLSVSLAEAQTSALLTGATDSIAVQAQEPQPLLPLASIVTDSEAIVLGSEVPTVQSVSSTLAINVTDALSCVLDDQLMITSSIAVSDTCSINLDEQATSPAVPAEEVALLLLEQAYLEITWREIYWGGGMRIEPAHDLYVGSYRMGPKNADETRGTEY